MIKEELRDKEFIVYESLRNALRNKKVAHSYLFTGVYSPLKIETAKLFAASIIKGSEDFIDEEDNIYLRIKDNKYFDVIYIDGYLESIKKNDIIRIMEEFSKTSLETTNTKVYILANINNSSPKVLNMILKFMEEPSNSDTYGIFISDNKDSLLSTVVSRCQEIPFKNKDFSYLEKEYIRKGFDDVDAYLLTNIYHELRDDIELNDECFLDAKEFIYKTIENLDNKPYLPMMVYDEIFPNYKDGDLIKKFFDLYIKIMIIMIEDALSVNEIADRDYNNHLRLLGEYRLDKLLRIFIDANDKIVLNGKRELLFDKMLNEILKGEL